MVGLVLLAMSLASGFILVRHFTAHRKQNRTVILGCGQHGCRATPWLTKRLVPVALCGMALPVLLVSWFLTHSFSFVSPTIDPFTHGPTGSEAKHLRFHARATTTEIEFIENPAAAEKAKR